MQAHITSNDSRVSIGSGDGLDIRSLRVDEGVSQLFRIQLTGVCRNQDIDFRAVVGQGARVSLARDGDVRMWDGVVEDISQTRVEPDGLATYELTIVPWLWLATQRQNYRVFQNLSELDIVLAMLTERGLRHENRTRYAYRRRSFVLQYGESDFAFISRLLESIGVSYTFAAKGEDLAVVLSDALEAETPSVTPLPFFDSPPAHERRWVNQLAVRQRVRPGRHRIQDLDYRRPSDAQPTLEFVDGLPQEQSLEVMEWAPGAFLYEVETPGDTPAADDRGTARTDTVAGRQLVENRLLAARSTARVVSFQTPAIDLVPGQCLLITGHPSREVDGKPLLVVRSVLEGGANSLWRAHVECAATDQPYRAPMNTPKPRISGVESAVVVGPLGEEIHTDELGRVRVQFHWDRQGGRNERSSCWLHVNQPWGGAGFGAINLPRVGQEVLIEFVGGDPDRPLIMGRVFTTTQPPPYKLPGNKKLSGIRSATSPALAGAMLESALTGLLGGSAKPMAATDLDGVLQHPFFQAQSPDSSTHKWSGNELSFFDQPNAQQLYLQAERNMNTVVKNAATTIVGNSRATQIGTDDIQVVGNRQSQCVADNQTIDVGGNRSIFVGGEESHTTCGDLGICTYSNLTCDVTNKWTTHAQIQEHNAKDLTVLQVGKSRIVMRPDFIIIQSTDVFINPGDVDTNAAINDGARPTTELDKERKAADVAAANEQRAADAAVAYEEAFQDGDLVEMAVQDTWNTMNDYPDMTLPPDYFMGDPQQRQYGLDEGQAAEAQRRLEALIAERAAQ